MSIFAKRFLENCFHDVWVLASLENLDCYYSKMVTGIFPEKYLRVLTEFISNEEV